MEQQLHCMNVKKSPISVINAVLFEIRVSCFCMFENEPDITCEVEVDKRVAI